MNLAQYLGITIKNYSSGAKISLKTITGYVIIFNLPHDILLLRELFNYIYKRIEVLAAAIEK